MNSHPYLQYIRSQSAELFCESTRVSPSLTITGCANVGSAGSNDPSPQDAHQSSSTLRERHTPHATPPNDSELTPGPHPLFLAGRFPTRTSNESTPSDFDADLVVVGGPQFAYSTAREPRPSRDRRRCANGRAGRVRRYGSDPVSVDAAPSAFDKLAPELAPEFAAAPCRRSGGRMAGAVRMAGAGRMAAARGRS